MVLNTPCTENLRYIQEKGKMQKLSIPKHSLSSDGNRTRCLQTETLQRQRILESESPSWRDQEKAVRLPKGTFAYVL